MKPETSALFVLDSEGDMDVILHAIRGLGGRVIGTNVDVARASLIRATLDKPEGVRWPEPGRWCKGPATS